MHRTVAIVTFRAQSRAVQSQSRLTLYKMTNNFEADDVLYKLYWDGVAPNQAHDS